MCLVSFKDSSDSYIEKPLQICRKTGMRLLCDYDLAVEPHILATAKTYCPPRK